MGESLDTHAARPTRLPEFIRSCREAIVQRWESALREASPAQGLPSPVLRDAVPQVLELARRHRAARPAGRPPGARSPGRGARARLSEVLSNLLSNALKYGEPGQPVRLQAFAHGDEVELAVCNAGTPIAPELLPVLFLPFRRGEGASGTQPGFGLGLFIVDQPVRAHGGAVEVSSTREAGTTFGTRLPRTVRARSAAQAEELPVAEPGLDR